MNKHRFIILLGTALWISGIIAFLSGILVYRSGSTQAQTANTTYNSTWTVQDYLNCKDAANAEVTLGPNMWKVAGTISSGQNFKETWTPTFGPIVETDPTPTYQLCKTTLISPSQKSIQTKPDGTKVPDVKNNGLYFASWLGHANQGFSLIIFHIAGTYPTKWTVSGCVGTSCP